MQKYIIPKRLLKKNTIFEGVGFKEMMLVVAGIAIGLVQFFTFKALFNVIIGIITLVIPVGLTVLLVVPFDYGENLMIKGKRYLAFMKQQRTYYYRRWSR